MIIIRASDEAGDDSTERDEGNDNVGGLHNKSNHHEASFCEEKKERLLPHTRMSIQTDQSSETLEPTLL